LERAERDDLKKQAHLVNARFRTLSPFVERCNFNAVLTPIHAGFTLIHAASREKEASRTTALTEALDKEKAAHARMDAMVKLLRLPSQRSLFQAPLLRAL